MTVLKAYSKFAATLLVGVSMCIAGANIAGADEGSSTTEPTAVNGADLNPTEANAAVAGDGSSTQGPGIDPCGHILFPPTMPPPPFPPQTPPPPTSCTNPLGI